jgi:AhpD family alkylhydroperoxidase
MLHDSPSPTTNDILDAGERPAFIPYPDLGERNANVPIYVRPHLDYYVARMGFLPTTIHLYCHVPWIAEYLFNLNNAIMRDERSTLSEHFKYKLAIIASRDNECEYCTAHHAVTLQRRWGYDERQVADVLKMTEPVDEKEAAAFAFVHQTSLDPAGVTDAMRARLAAAFTPEEVMTIVLVAGFWKMYNTMHTAMAAPLEDPVMAGRPFVNVAAERAP